jgi:hypothetical protein
VEDRRSSREECLHRPIARRHQKVRSRHGEIHCSDLRNRIRHKRPALRLVVSSATIDAAAFFEYFSSGSSPGDVIIASLEGRMYPVEVGYLREPTADYVQTAVEAVKNIHTNVGVEMVLSLPGRAYLLNHRMVRVTFWCFLQVARR